MAAICVLESDLRPGVVAWHRVPGRDGSASAPRAAGRAGGATFYKIAYPGQGRAGARLWAASAGATRHLKLVADVGLCGVRCVLGPDRRCTNWPVRGLTVAALQDTRTNIAAAARILAKKRARCGARALDCYAGDPDGSSGRTADVRALVAAFAGVELQVKKARVRELVGKIAAAVRRERRS